MLSDRFYMRGRQGGAYFTFIPWFLGVLVGVFVLQNLLERWFPGLGSYYQYSALSGSGIRHGYVWTLVSYGFLHGSFTHLLLNGLGLFFIGRQLEVTLGPPKLIMLTLISALISAGFWLAVNYNRPGQVVGASGVVMAYLMVFACLNPSRPITFLIFFVIPVTMKPFWMVAIVGGIDLVGFFWDELPGGQNGWIAHSAHLGGLAGGWMFYRAFILRGFLFSMPTIEAPRLVGKTAARPPAYSVNLAGRSSPSAPAPSSRQHLRVEVDRILDKINERGFGSLTADEKRVLDEAREVLGPR